MEEPRTATSKICRLCLEDLNRTTNFGIDLSPASEIRQLIKDIYTVEILPTDHVKFICVRCYKCLLKNHNNLVQRENKKRIAQMNQIVLQAQQTTIEETQENDAVVSRMSAGNDLQNDSSKDSTPERSISSKLPVEEQNSNASVNKLKVLTSSNVERKQGTSNEAEKTDRSRSVTPQVSGGRETRKSSLERNLRLESSEKQLEPLLLFLQGDTKQEGSSSEPKQRKQNESEVTPPSSGCLIPVVLDCMTTPEYLEALFPLKISRGPDDVKPLEYLCDFCFQIFKKEDDYRNHRKHGCTRACRYCFARIKSQHSCALTSKHSLLNSFIRGSEKYCTRTDTRAETSELNELSENPKGKSSRSHASSEDRKAKGTTNKSGHDTSPMKTTGKIRHTPTSRFVSLVESSSSDSSTDVSTIFNVDTSDEEYNNLLNDVRNKIRKTKTKRNKIAD